ncbi:winged helix-turn-helix domain-containing protein [Paucibacter sp. TC2R-5]|uniref:winged helix-turn-helix domain-containing protein n=1 Tax=Paucibacter sp. TC2R-5 TaxID=2893555 RepID=UPI0021E38A86|nr:winged helix-turn-helix domain-containing protein [Paucibacter sp. TC2R-5]MCV2359018.1 winged helix-turn-helix domain-containing protein [Paucibacter sp. TC2R-5]
MPRYCFDHCVIDTLKHSLSVQGQPAEVQPLIFDLLLFFARNPQRMLNKDELLDAVWKTSFVTDSVVARAVMKARRVLQAAGSSEDIIKTVRGVGYRFDASVELRQDSGKEAASGTSPTISPAASPPKPATLTLIGVMHPKGSRPTLAVLPFVNQAGDPQFDWAERGLAGLVHHQLEAKGKIAVASMNATSDWRSHFAWGAEALSHACQQLGTEKALLCRFSRSDQNVYALESLYGSAERDLESRLFEGGDLLALAAAMVGYLEAQFDPAQVPEPLYWEEQLARALDFELRGDLVSALPLLESCMQRLDVTPSIHLVHARLLREQSAAMDQARVAAYAALEGARAADKHDLQVDVYAELSRIDINSGDLPSAARQCELGLALVFSGQASVGVLANILIARADLERFQGQSEVAAKTVARAVEAAKAAGDVYRELLASCLYGHVLMGIPLMPKAIDTLRNVVREARLRGLVRVELQAYMSLGTALSVMRQYGEAVEAIRRAALLATSLGYQGKYLGSKIQETFILIDAGRLVEAESSTHDCIRLMGGDVPIYLSSAHGRAHAHLQWRAGLLEQAVQQQEQMLDLARKWGWYTRWLCAALLCSWYITIGREADAQTALEVLKDDNNLARRSRSEAALLLHQSRREEAKACLRMAWSTSSSESAAGQDLAVDLGWMLLEDGQGKELEFLMRSVTKMSAEHAPTALLQSVYAWKAMYAGEAQQDWLQKWQALLQQVPALVRNVPALIGEGGLLGLLRGEQPAFHLLLNNACD